MLYIIHIYIYIHVYIHIYLDMSVGFTTFLSFFGAASAKGASSASSGSASAGLRACGGGSSTGGSRCGADWACDMLGVGTVGIVTIWEWKKSTKSGMICDESHFFANHPRLVERHVEATDSNVLVFTIHTWRKDMKQSWWIPLPNMD